MDSGGRKWATGAVIRPYLLVMVAVGVLQTYYYALRYVGALGDWLSYLLVPLSLLGLLWLWIRLDGRPAKDFGWLLYEKPLRTLGLVGLLTATYLLVVLEAGLFVGFVRQPLPSIPVAGLLLLAAPVIGLSQVGIFQGYFLRAVADRGHFVRALSVSSIGFALATTNLSLIPSLSVTQAGDYLFLNAGTGFALGLFLGLFVYKSRWTIFGPAMLRMALGLVPFLLPYSLGASSWEFAFLMQICAYCAMMFLVVLLLREPSYLAQHYLGEEFGSKRYRFLRRDRSRLAFRRTVLALLIVVPLSFAAVFGLQAWSGTRTPLLAIATGSMAPTLVRGDLVLVEHVGPNQIAVGDIVAYSGTCLPAPTVHRVISITSGPSGPIYLTKGDANPSADPCVVPYSEVMGKVVSTVPAAGYFILQPALPIGVVALAILIPSVLRREAPRPSEVNRW